MSSFSLAPLLPAPVTHADTMTTDDIRTADRHITLRDQAMRLPSGRL